jgi:hypothetical protein
VKLAFLAQELRVDTDDLEAMLQDLISRGELLGAEIDQVHGCLELSAGGQETPQDRKVRAMIAWAEALQPLMHELPERTS